jgi:hypothetical protein
LALIAVQDELYDILVPPTNRDVVFGYREV